MGKIPKFSVLLCTVGKPELVGCAIRSMLVQTDPDFEVIITDASGGDDVRRVVSGFKDERLKFFSVPDGDPSIAWGYAYDVSCGEYVLWYDDDNALVPWALERYRKVIEDERADLVSGNHVYYFGPNNRHYPGRDNTLGVLLPFSFTLKLYDPKDVLSAVYDFSFGTEKMPARWHSAATFVSRSVCDSIKAVVGQAMIPKLLGNFHFHPLLFAFAKRPVYDDRPLCVIGKFSSSQTQQWSNTFVKEKRSTLPYEFTGVSARTLGNTTAECYLRAKDMLKPMLDPYKLNFNKFFSRYAGELVYIDLPLMRHLSHWAELWRAASARSMEGVSLGRFKLMLLRLFSKFILVKLLKLLKLWSIARLKARGVLSENPRRKFVALDVYNVKSIDACAAALDKVMLDRFEVGVR
jgi:glycosyltransferase involved in cell wall biosynthesis